MKPSKLLMTLGFAMIVFGLVMVPAGAALAKAKQVATLSSYSGKVIIRSQGSWGVKPQNGLPLYSGDKVVTRIGNATLSFDDGAVIRIANNSNLTVEEVEEKKGFFTRTRSVKRRLRLLLGKLRFATGRNATAKTVLETPTAVCGLRGTAGLLSIDADGKTYIQFTEGGKEYQLGEILSGEAPDVPAEIADMNPAQLAAFVAATAADQAAAAGTDEAAQAAALAAAREALAAANLIIENNPDPDIVEEAKEVAAEAQRLIDELTGEKKRDPLNPPLPEEPPIEDVAGEGSPM